jgi:uncharacterized protein
MTGNEQLAESLDALKDLSEDNTVPKNIKLKINNIIKSLEDEKDLSIRVNRALNELDEISDNNNIQSYTRTQIWNVVSILESIQN